MKRTLRLTCGQAALALLLLTSPAATAQLELVADINQASAPDQSAPAQFTSVNGTVIFAATSGDEGRELWKTDGTEAGTVLLKDIWPGNQSSSPLILAATASTVFFAANDGTHGVELWKTDGSEAGTVLVKDIFPGSEGGNPLSGIIFNGMLFFSAQNYDRNYELWKSDGTEAGTVMVTDLQSNSVNPGSNPTRFVSIGTKLLFLAYTDTPGQELWATDGTAGGTALVKDITPGNSSAYFGPYAVMNNVVYFGTGDGSHGNELWRSDGTGAGTYMVKDVFPGSGNAAVGEIIAVGNTLYFSAGASSFNNELWKSDGTDAGTVLVKEINPSTAQFHGSDPFGFKAVGSTVYFFANDGSTGVELWKTDGTTGGTVQVKDIFPGSSSGPPAYTPFAATLMEVMGTKVYFTATDGVNGSELWTSDGTAGGTMMVKDLAPGSASASIKELKAIGSKLYFAAAPTGGGGEPFVSDGTAGGTGLLKKISSATAGSNPADLTPTGGKLFFSANDSINGRELWVVDGPGAHITRAVSASTVDNTLSGLGALNGTAFFGSTVNASNDDYQLFRSDGTAGGTFPVAQSGPGSALPLLPGSYRFKAAGNVGFFTGYTPAQGTELWRTDGTGAGTFLIKDFYPGADSPELGEMTSLGSELYFVGDTDAGGKELWKSDGTAAGTVIVKALGGGWPGSEPYGLCPFGTTLYFSADGPSVGNELYKTNGTAAGTTLVKDIADGSSFAAFTTPLNSTTLLFSAFKQDNGTELWKTNGTAAGTVLVKNIRPGSFFSLGGITGYGSYPYGLVRRGPESTAYQFAVINGVAYFSADDGTHGRELWKTDGTDAGTVMVKDIAPDAADSSPFSMVVVGDKIYFFVTLSGATQLWKSDGTEAGTVMVDDQVQNLDNLTLSGTDLYMTGSQSAVGNELFRLPNVRPAPFAIAQSPLGTTLTPGASVTLTAAATTPIPGALPLTYLWRKNGLAIPGATKTSLMLSKVTEANQGAYDLLIRSGDFELLTTAAQVDVTDPAKVAITQQPLPKLVLTGGSATFQVEAVGQAPFTYQWYKGTAPVQGATTDTLTLNNVQMADAGLYQVKVSNSLGSLLSSTAQLAVVSGANVTAYGKQGAALSLAAPVTGTGLTFQWLYYGSVVVSSDFGNRITGITSSKLVLNGFNISDQGDFTCLVSLGGQSVISGKLTAKVALAITGQPAARLVLSGSSPFFQVFATGQAPLAYQWYKGATPISGATSSFVFVNNVQAADAALYHVKVSNSLDTKVSASVQLAVVSSANVIVPVKQGTTVSLTAPATGTGLKYQWLYNGSTSFPSSFGSRISGSTTSKLSIAKFAVGDQGDFTCRVSLGGLQVTSGKLTPMVAAIPIITATTTPPTWIVSGFVSTLASTLFTQSNLTAWNAPTSFTITGLPAGLTYDTKTGLIIGRPLTGGGTSVTLGIKVGNVAGSISAPISVTIPIQAFPALAKGAFRGLADRSNTTLNDNLGDYVQVDITANGSISGKLYRGTTMYPITGSALNTAVDSTQGSCLLFVTRPGATTLGLAIAVNGSTGAMTGTLTDGANTVNVTFVRSPWTTVAPANPATAYSKAYTAALQLQPAQQGDMAYPQGEGYAVASITTAGAVTGAVRLADSTKVTFSTLLGAAGEIPLHIGAYNNTGSFHGMSQITSATGNWDGTDTFFKAAQPGTSTTRSYKGGVPLHTLTLVGGTWVKPTPAALLLGVMDNGAPAAPNNADLRFTQGGISSSHLAVSGAYDTPVRIKAPASLLLLPANNPGKLTLSFASQLTGEITGTFTTTDANPVLAGKTVTRTTSYYGVIVQRLGDGRGHFNLAALPDVNQADPLKTAVLSGLVELRVTQ